MAARIKTRNYTFTSGDPVQLSAIVNSTLDTFIGTLAVRTPLANGNLVYWRDASGGQNGGHLGPDEAVTMDLYGKFVATTDLWFLGTSGDVIEITVIG